MSAPLPSPRRPGPTRRAVVTAVAVGLGAGLAGCTTDEDPGAPRGRTTPGATAAEQADHDVTVAALALAGEQRAVDAVRATVSRHGTLAGLLSPLVEMHTAHVDLLAEAAPEEASTAGESPTASPSSPADGHVRVPGNPRAALRKIVALEEELTTSSKRHAFAARSGAFARLLASMAASSAQSATVLAAAVTDEPRQR